MTRDWPISLPGIPPHPEIVRGPAVRLFEPPSLNRASVRVLVPDQAAIVLGSSQPDAAVSIRPPHVDVVRRRSGGGAVWLDEAMVWVDIVIPHGHQLAERDVGRAMWWIGAVWAEAIPEAEVHRGAMVRSQHSSAVCFAGLGPGEVTVAGRKVVGISQRRTREGALFQCGALLAWEPARLCAALGIPEAVISLDSVAAATSPGAIDRALTVLFKAVLGR